MRTDNAATHIQIGDTRTQPHASKSRWPLFCGAYAFGNPIQTIGEQAKMVLINSPRNFVVNTEEEQMWWIHFPRVAEMMS